MKKGDEDKKIRRANETRVREGYKEKTKQREGEGRGKMEYL
jgi:hypothetical protein